MMKYSTTLFLIVVLLISFDLASAQSNFWIKTNAPDKWIGGITCNSSGRLFACANDLVVSSIIESTDRGETWNQVNLSATLAMFNYILVDSNDYIYVTTNSKIYRSKNTGKTWETIISGLPSSHNINQLTIFNNILFIASTKGIFQSSNSGDSWVQLNTGNNGLPSTDNIKGVGFAKNGEIFVSEYSDLGFYTSLDNGWSWQKKSNYYSSIIKSNSKNQVFIDDNNHSQGILKSLNLGSSFTPCLNISQKVKDIFISKTDDIYVSLTGGERIYRSTNDGISWTVISTGMFESEAWNFAVDNSGYLYLGTNAGIYRSENPIYLTTLSPPVLVSPSNNSINVSISPILSWTSVSDAVSYHFQISTDEKFLTKVLDVTGIKNISKQINGLANYTKYYWRVTATDGNITSDWSSVWTFSTQQSISKSWQAMNWPSKNLGIQAISVNSQNHIFVCTRADGIYRSTDLGNNWTKLNNGLSFDYVTCISIDELGRIFIGTLGDGVYYSNTNGDSWKKIGLASKTVIKISALNNYIFAGDGFNCTGVFRSSNLGSIWVNVNSGLGACTGSVITTKSGLVFGGSGIDGMFKSTNHGDTWQQINDGLTSSNIASIVADDIGTVYAGTRTNIYTGMKGKGLFKLTNHGDTWQNLTNGITTQEISELAIGQNGFVVTSGAGNKAIFSSTNNGSSWNQLVSGLPDPADIGPLGITNSGYIFAVVNSQIYRYNDPTTNINNDQQILEEYNLSQNFPNPFNPTTNISFSLPKRSNVKLVVYDVLGKEVATLANSVYEAGKYDVQFNGNNLPSGVYFYNLTTSQVTISKKMLLMK